LVWKNACRENANALLYSDVVRALQNIEVDEQILLQHLDLVVHILV
jgi:hypothetical protein